MNLVIYGAQAIALGTYIAIKELHPEMNILCFLVTSMENNLSSLRGVPVIELNTFVAEMDQIEKDGIEVLIGTPENLVGEIEEKLESVGLHNHTKIDSKLWAEMQEKVFENSAKYKPLSTYFIGTNVPYIRMFKMVHQHDKTLKSKYIDPEYMVSIQVGAVFSDKIVADLCDSIQDNISEKNGDYSELTGLYWIWKNIIKQDGINENKYYGLAHYRRFLNLSEDDLNRLCENDIDVVLPYPMPYEPNIEAHHRRYLSDQEWGGVIKALEELEPKYANALPNILEQEYLYNYNIIVAKNSVINDYCTWLFRLLFRIEEINNPDGTKEPNRYIGYAAETLETLYFMYNRDKLKIAHAGCRFLL